MRWRSALAGLALVVGLVAYVAGAVTLADVVLPAHRIVTLAFFLVAGVAWIYPAVRVIAWAARDDRESTRR